MFAFPAAQVGVALVHAHQLSGKQRRLVATGPSADFDQRIAVLVRIGGQQGVLQLAAEFHDLRLQLGDFLRRHRGKVRIVRFCQLLIVRQMALGRFEFLPEFQRLLELAVFAQDLRRALGVGKKFRITHRLFQLREAVAAFGDEQRIVHAGHQTLKPPKRKSRNVRTRKFSSIGLFLQRRDYLSNELCHNISWHAECSNIHVARQGGSTESALRLMGFPEEWISRTPSFLFRWGWGDDALTPLQTPEPSLSVRWAVSGRSETLRRTCNLSITAAWTPITAAWTSSTAVWTSSTVG